LLLTGYLPVESGSTRFNTVAPNLLGALDQPGLVFFAKEAKGLMRHDQLDGQVFIVDGELELDVFTETFTGHPDIGLADIGDILPHEILLTVLTKPLVGLCV
jgi:hypothetical protein